MLDEEAGIFLAGGFEEEDLAARVDDTAPRLDAADAADAFMLDTSFLVLLLTAIPDPSTRPSVTARAIRRPEDRLLEKGRDDDPRRAASFALCPNYTMK